MLLFFAHCTGSPVAGGKRYQFNYVPGSASMTIHLCTPSSSLRSSLNTFVQRHPLPPSFPRPNLSAVDTRFCSSSLYLLTYVDPIPILYDTATSITNITGVRQFDLKLSLMCFYCVSNSFIMIKLPAETNKQTNK